MIYCNRFNLLTKFNNESHKTLYYENLYRILGITSLDLTKKIYTNSL